MGLMWTSQRSWVAETVSRHSEYASEGPSCDSGVDAHLGSRVVRRRDVGSKTRGRRRCMLHVSGSTRFGRKTRRLWTCSCRWRSRSLVDHAASRSTKNCMSTHTVTFEFHKRMPRIPLLSYSHYMIPLNGHLQYSHMSSIESNVPRTRMTLSMVQSKITSKLYPLGRDTQAATWCHCQLEYGCRYRQKYHLHT